MWVKAMYLKRQKVEQEGTNEKEKRKLQTQKCMEI
jgi:hypothetical protein